MLRQPQCHHNRKGVTVTSSLHTDYRLLLRQRFNLRHHVTLTAAELPSTIVRASWQTSGSLHAINNILKEPKMSCDGIPWTFTGVACSPFVTDCALLRYCPVELHNTTVLPVVSRDIIHNGLVPLSHLPLLPCLLSPWSASRTDQQHQ